MSGWLYQPLSLRLALSGDLTGTASFAFTATGVLTGTGALTGTATMTFSASGTMIDQKRSLLYRPRASQLMPLLHY